MNWVWLDWAGIDQAGIDDWAGLDWAVGLAGLGSVKLIWAVLGLAQLV